MNVISFDASPRSAAWRGGGTFLAMGAAFVGIGWWEGWSGGAVTMLSGPCFVLGLFFAFLRVRFVVDPERRRMVKTIRSLGLSHRQRIPWQHFTEIRVGRRVIPMMRHREEHFPVELRGSGAPIEIFVASDHETAARRAHELAPIFRVPVRLSED